MLNGLNVLQISSTSNFTRGYRSIKFSPMYYYQKIVFFSTKFVIFHHKLIWEILIFFFNEDWRCQQSCHIFFSADSTTAVCYHYLSHHHTNSTFFIPNIPDKFFFLLECNFFNFSLNRFGIWQLVMINSTI